MAVDVGKPEIAALEAVCQAGVVEAQQMKQGGVEVVDVYRVAGNVEADRVGLAVHVAREVNFFSRPANPLSIWSSSFPKPEISAEHHCQACSKQAGCQLIRPAAQM